MVRISCATGELYHAYNRGVDKRVTFMDKEDYNYFIHLLYALNNSENKDNIRRDYATHINSNSTQKPNHADEGGQTSLIPGMRLVDILVFTLMSNHYHLLLRQRVDGGIGLFMQKLGTGYTMYFNDKHIRTGTLFQGVYKRSHVESDRYLLFLPHYIHLNPLALYTGDGPHDAFLRDYPWSSYRDYIGIQHYPSILETETITGLFGGSNKYRQDIEHYILGSKHIPQEDTSILIDR